MVRARASSNLGAPGSRVASRARGTMGEDLGHVVYRGPEGETTEWDDIQRRLGNLPPAPEVHKPDAYVPASDPDTRTVAHIDEQTADALEEMDDEFADDAFLERYRRERIAELKARAAIPRFGAVVPITRDAFTSEVTDPSADHHVVVLLHRPGCPDCELVSLAVDELARKNPFCKFTSIPGGECIPGYPASNMPTLLVYRHRDVARTFVGLDAFGGRRMTPEGVRLALNECGPVCRGLVAPGEDDDAEVGAEEAARRRYAEEVVARMIEDAKELRERSEAKDDR